MNWQAKAANQSVDNNPPQTQREAAAEEEEEEVQAKILRQAEEDEEEIQTKPVPQVQFQEEKLQMQSVVSPQMEVSESLEKNISAAAGSGQSLPAGVLKPMEQAFGADFGGVRVHTDSQADGLNRQLNARAFTTGRDIFFRDTEYSPGSDSGRKLIAHELTHVVQQTGSPTSQTAGGSITGNRMMASTIQRDVTIGGALPTFEEVNATHFYTTLSRDKARKIEKEVIDEQKAASLASAITKAADPNKPAAADADTVAANLKNKIDTAESYAPACTILWEDAQTTIKHKWVLTELFTHLNKDLPAKIRSMYPSLDTSLKKREAALGDKVKTIPGAEIITKFATAIKSMPGFKALLASLKKKGKATANLATDWKDKGPLADKIEEKEVTGVTRVRTDIANGKFAQKVNEADAFYRQIVQPDILSTIPRPKIVVHLQNAVDADPVNGFRAYCSSGEVHVGQNPFRETIVHEIGHHVENFLPQESWQSIQLLLRARHTGAGGGTAVAIGPTTEARYKGTYAATGEYTARAYEGPGATEVMSMTAQFLSEPGKIENTVDKDPQQVAVILRTLRPTEYAGHAALREFDQYIP
jgi:hypothetical protein